MTYYYIVLGQNPSENLAQKSPSPLDDPRVKSKPGCPNCRSAEMVAKASGSSVLSHVATNTSELYMLGFDDRDTALAWANDYLKDNMTGRTVYGFEPVGTAA